MKPQLPKRVRPHVNPLADQTSISFAGFEELKPLIVDLGAYRGEFTQKLLDLHGDKYNYMVTELRTPYTKYLTELFAAYDHVQVFGSDSARNICGLLEQSVQSGVQISYLFVNFPDPWFKEKHKKRRVVSERFLNDIYDLFYRHSQLIFQTDQQPLFDETLELIRKTGKWQIDLFHEPLWGIQSHWELAKVAEGSEIYRAKIFVK